MGEAEVRISRRGEAAQNVIEPHPLLCLHLLYHNSLLLTARALVVSRQYESLTTASPRLSTNLQLQCLAAAALNLTQPSLYSIPLEQHQTPCTAHLFLAYP